MITNIPTDLLRAFVTVVDLGGYTKAADALGRTQPAISMQIKRLEDLLRAKLLRHDSRQLVLTDAGVAIGPYARQILRLNDDVVAHFANEAVAGWIKIGVSTDFSNTFLVEAITRFAAEHPEVRVEVDSRLSADLRAALAADQIDMMVGIAPETETPFLVESTTMLPFWAVSETFRHDLTQPLPLVRHPHPCEYANRMQSALRLSGKSWRTVLVATDIAGVQAAVKAGIGATALTPATLVPGIRIGRADEGFPPLQALRIGLFYKHSRLNKPAQTLATWLIEQIQRAGQTPYA